jgi:hypothetical protein
MAPSIKKTLFLLILLLTIILILNNQTGVGIQSNINPISINKKDSLQSLKSQHNISEITGLVFYGRRSSVKILLRYLEINLKKNGGILDKVIFAVHTPIKEDIDFIQEFVSKNNASYEIKIYPITIAHEKSYFKELYSTLNNNDIVFKIDDDIVFIANGTFELMLKEYLKRNDFILSANVINHSQLSYVHARQRAILPFYEVKPYNWIKAENISEIDDTIVFNSTYAAYSSWWRNGKFAAVARESFLYHAYNNSLDAYKFSIWDFNSVGYHERVRINFIIFWGKNANKLAESKAFTDETYLSIDMPKKLKKHTISLGSTLVAHFSYWVQIGYLSKTNILEKYDNFSLHYLNSSNTVSQIENFLL